MLQVVLFSTHKHRNTNDGHWSLLVIHPTEKPSSLDFHFKVLTRQTDWLKNNEVNFMASSTQSVITF